MKKLSFKSRIIMGFCFVFASMLFTILYTILQLSAISQNMELVYSHPFKVSNAIREIKIEIYKSARLLRDMQTIDNKNQINSLEEEINKSERNSNEYIRLISNQYLGDKNDVDSMFKAFSEWKTIKTVIYRLKFENKTDSLDWMIKSLNHDLVNKIIYHSNIISDFASNKAKASMEQTLEKKDRSLVILFIILILVSIMVVLISYQISKSISVPLNKFIRQAIAVFSIQSEKPDLKFNNEEELFDYTLTELKQAYQNIEQQNEEIKSNNEQLAIFNKSLEEKVYERTLDLKESEERFRGAFETSAIGMALVSTKGFYMQVNSSLCRILGFEKDELLFKTFQEISHPDDLQKDLELLNKTIQGEISNYQIEKRYYRKNKEIVWVNLSVSLLRGNDNQPLYFVSQVEDITKRKLTEEKLNYERYLMNTLMDNVPANIYFKDIESRFIRVNNALSRLFNLNYPGQAEGKTDFDFFSYEHAQQAFEDEQEIIRTGLPIRKEERETWANLPDTWVSTVKLPFCNKDGKIIGTFGISMDITELKRAEESLQKSEEQFRTIFVQAPLGIALIDSYSGQILEANQMYEKIIGRNKEELSSINWMSYTHYDDVQVDLDKMALLNAGEIDGFQMEERYILKNGNIVWVNMTVAQLKAGDFVTPYHLCMIEDITQRKASDEKIKGLSNIIEKSLNEVYVFDIDSLNFYFVNSSALKNLGFSFEEMKVLTPIDIKPEYNAESFANEIKPLLDGEIEILRFETIHRRKNGSTYPVEVNLQLSEYDGKKVFATIVLDITERKKAEIQLKETNKSLEEMVYIASHDLQVPLVSMEGYASELLENYSGKFDDEGKYCLTRLQANASRMHKLVLSLLDISRLNTKKLAYEKFNLNYIVQKIIQDISLTIEKHNAVINVGKLPELNADKIRIEGVFRNLIINSLNYDGKTISLGYKNNTLFVEDDGIGVPEGQLERIFNPGERLKKNNAEGVGMGLTFCKKVVEQHQGEIWAESPGENKGTTIYIKLT